MLKFIQKAYKSLLRVNEFEWELNEMRKKLSGMQSELASSQKFFAEEIEKKDREIAQYKEENLNLNNLIKELTHPGVVLKEILKGNLEWYDYQELTPSDREAYQRFADAVRTNPAFVNEMNHLFQILALKALSEPKTLEGLRDLQICAVAVESIKRHFAEIPMPPKKPEEVKEPNSTF